MKLYFSPGAYSQAAHIVRMAQREAVPVVLEAEGLA